jgi:lipopolysaccharide heptosyltransferase I
MDSARILLIRTSALGDVIHALPVLTALRRNLPQARIGWLVEEAYLPLLEAHPDLDETIPVRLRAWRNRPFSVSTWEGLRTFLRQLEAFHPDIVLDLMGNHKSGILAALTMSDRRIGLARAFRREPSSAIWINEPMQPDGSHAVDRMLSLLGALGISTKSIDFGEKALREALGLEARESQPRAPQIVIHPGAGWVNKRYPPSQWGRVAKILHDRADIQTRVISTESERVLVEEIEQTSSGSAVGVSAPELRSLASELDRATLVMGGDTGPIHLAHALGREVLCVMGPTDPKRNGPYGAEENVVWHSLPCSFCHRRYGNPQRCMLDLAPETVAERAIDLLEENT